MDSIKVNSNKQKTVEKKDHLCTYGRPGCDVMISFRIPTYWVRYFGYFRVTNAKSQI